MSEEPAVQPVEPPRRPRVAVAETDRLGVIQTLDAAAADLLNCDSTRAAGSRLMRFVDPVSQRQFLADIFRARHTRGTMSSRIFLRPRGKLPVRCQATVSRAPLRDGALQWTFRPDGAANGASAVGPPTPSGTTSAAFEGCEAAAKRLSRDLHDDAGQLLAALHLAIDAAGRDLPEPARARVLSMRDLVRSVEERLRLLSHEIRMPAIEEIGLPRALEALGRSIALRSRTEVTIRVAHRSRMAVSTEAHLYRIAQEAMANAVRHGRPRRITVRLRKSGDKVLLSVADDGQGFDLAEARAVRADRGIGLTGIQERVEAIEGTLSMESSPGKGTTITVMAPLWL